MKSESFASAMPAADDDGLGIENVDQAGEGRTE